MSTHDLTAARQHGIIGALADEGLKCWADKAYQGAGGSVRVPFRGRRLQRGKRHRNTAHAKIRCVGEQAMATIKNLVRAVFVLHTHQREVGKGLLPGRGGARESYPAPGPLGMPPNCARRRRLRGRISHQAVVFFL
ncbi:transposase family protein [Streptomyces capillispiralis]|uniref:transposase family protein n=1 Tax=Streptomyces capillispiralis TaxID=68182 RepID=UPI0019942AB5|nr:hypothetical protein GCM10017779_54530 [Streptomyces capillispiralis]